MGQAYPQSLKNIPHSDFMFFRYSYKGKSMENITLSLYIYIYIHISVFYIFSMDFPWIFHISIFDNNLFHVCYFFVTSFAVAGIPYRG